MVRPATAQGLQYAGKSGAAEKLNIMKCFICEKIKA